MNPYAVRIMSRVQSTAPMLDEAVVRADPEAPTRAVASMASHMDDNVPPPRADLAAEWDRCAGKADDSVVFRLLLLHSAPHPVRRPCGCASAGKDHRRCQSVCHNTQHRCQSRSTHTAAGMRLPMRRAVHDRRTQLLQPLPLLLHWRCPHWTCPQRHQDRLRPRTVGNRRDRVDPPPC